MRPLLTAMFCATLLTAQQGEYKIYGSACVGTGFQCAGANTLGGDQPQGGNTNEFAIDVPASNEPVDVLGLELWTRSSSGRTENLTVSLYVRGAGGKPDAVPVATGTMQVGTESGWYSAMFSRLVTVPRDIPYFVAFGGNDRVLHPLVNTGTRSTYHWRTDANSSWNRAATRQRWAFKVLCASGEFSPPEIFSTDVPTLDQSMTVRVRAAKPTTPAVLFTGATPISIELGFMGARGLLAVGRAVDPEPHLDRFRRPCVGALLDSQ